MSVYGGELASEITMDDNNDGAFIIYKRNAENFIKKFWDEASETYNDHVANFGKSDSFIPNPFSDPEKYTFFMEDWGVNNIISQVELVNDNWNDEMELTTEIIGCIKNQINDLSEFNKIMEIYTMEQWVRDGEFMAKPGQQITEEVYETMYNKLPPLDLPTGKAEYSLQCLNVPVHEGFLMGGSVGSGEKNEKLYYAFAKNNYGKGDKFYYIGLSPKEKVLTEEVKETVEKKKEKTR